jgi:hypothetical protein
MWRSALRMVGMAVSERIMNLEEFIASPLGNAWIKEPGIAYYVRKNLRFGGAIDLANVGSSNDGQKFGYWRFLKRYEKRYPFRVENVLNPDLARFYRRKGWHETRDQIDTPTFYSPLFVEQFGKVER